MRILIAVFLIGISGLAFAAGIATGNPTYDKYDSLIEAAVAKYGFPDPLYAKAMAWWESNQVFDANAVSDDSPCGGSGPESKSIGVFQITPQCGEGDGHSTEELKDPALNIDLSVKLLKSIYDDMQRAHPGCTQRQYLDMVGAGWVQNYETIVGCGEFTDDRQTNYAQTVGGKYEEWGGAGGGKVAAGEAPLPVESDGGIGNTPSKEPADVEGSPSETPTPTEDTPLEGPTVGGDTTSEGPTVSENSPPKNAGDASTGNACKSDVFQPPTGKGRERMTAFFLRRDVLEAKYGEGDELPAKCVKAKTVDDSADEKAPPAKSAGTLEINSKCKEGTKPEEDAFKAAAVSDAGLSEEDAAALDLSCKPDKPTAIDIPKDTNASFAEEFSGNAGNVPGGVWYFFDGWGGGDWRDAIYDKDHAKLDGNGNLVLTGEPGSDGNLHTSYLQTYNQANQDAPSPAKFGPGTYIEARIDMSGCGEIGSASWCAFWLFDPSDPYDANAANGTEIDILEFTRANSWSAERFTSSNHTINGEENNGAWHEGVNPSDGFHVYGLDWQVGSLKFFFDDKLVWETTEGVSGSNNQAIILSIENQKNLWAPNTITNSSVKMVVDYVRAYEGGKP